MLRSQARFQQRIDESRHSGAVYDYLCNNVPGPVNYDDLLRYQIVSAVSAFDTLIHDLVRIGMVAAYQGLRPKTDRFTSEPISLSVHEQLASASVPPAAVLFDAEVARKLSHLSFQDPDKVASALSLIWKEKHKWQRVSAALGEQEEQLKSRLRLVLNRRNAIVHECDLDPVTLEKVQISPQDASGAVLLLERCGNAIVPLVV